MARTKRVQRKSLRNVDKPKRVRKKCVHGKLKSRCKDCKGSEICDHGRRKSICKACGGSGICEHGKRKSRCKECVGSEICDHGRRKSRCKDCGGSEICEHGKQKSYCKDCGGSGLCEHGRTKRQCKDCFPLQKLLNSNRWCKNCCETLLGTNRVRSGLQICAKCDPTIPERIEHIVGDKIIDIIGYPPFAADDTLFGGSLCGEKSEKQRKPDLAWCIEYGRTVVVCEVDEKGGHPNEIVECELGRIWTLTDAFKKLMGEQTYVFFVRLNPDEYDGLLNVSLDDRIQLVSDRINWLLEMEDDELAQFDSSIPYVGYYFYHSKCHFQIEGAKRSTRSLKLLEIHPEL